MGLLSQVPFVQLLKLLAQYCEISKYVVLFVKCLYSVESAMLQDVDGITVLVRCYRVDSL